MTVPYYRYLLAQSDRIEAFRSSIREVVRDGDDVIDLGTGLGTFAFFAVDAGASRVWAVEGDPIVNVAKAVARANGYADRIEFIKGWFPDVSIPGKADVLIFEDFSKKLIDVHSYLLIKRAVSDLLKPGGSVIPERIRLMIAPLSSEEAWQKVAPFDGDEDQAYGIDWSASREYVLNTPHAVFLGPDALVGEPQVVLDFELLRLPDAAELTGNVSWEISEKRVVHGLLYWFDLELSPGLRVSNAPGESGPWGQFFLPAHFPIEVEAHQALSAGVGARDGLLAWEITCGEQRVRGSEFLAAPASLDDLFAMSPAHVPSLGERGELELEVLGLADGTRSYQEIAEMIRRANCDLDHDEALRLVANIFRGKIIRIRSSDVFKAEVEK